MSDPERASAIQGETHEISGQIITMSEQLKAALREHFLKTPNQQIRSGNPEAKKLASYVLLIATRLTDGAAQSYSQEDLWHYIENAQLRDLDFVLFNTAYGQVKHVIDNTQAEQSTQAA